jgi:hypothetical protein
MSSTPPPEGRRRIETDTFPGDDEYVVSASRRRCEAISSAASAAAHPRHMRAIIGSSRVSVAK